MKAPGLMLRKTIHTAFLEGKHSSSQTVKKERTVL